MHLWRFWTRILANVPYARSLHQEVPHMFIWWWEVYLPGTYFSSERFRNQMTDIGMGTLQAVLSHSAWKASFFTFKNKSADVSNIETWLLLSFCLFPLAEKMFSGKSWLLWKLCCQTTSVVEVGKRSISSHLTHWTFPSSLQLEWGRDRQGDLKKNPNKKQCSSLPQNGLHSLTARIWIKADSHTLFFQS